MYKKKKETYTGINLASWEGEEQVMWLLARKPYTENAEQTCAVSWQRNQFPEFHDAGLLPYTSQQCVNVIILVYW